MVRKRIGVVLSGCGVYDGSEIYEAVLTLFFLDRAGAEAICMAPDIVQTRVINHRTGEETGEQRQVLLESARLARGKIRALAEVSVDELDGLILPGGFGAAHNLSNLATDGAKARVIPELVHLLQAVHRAHKPIGAICIAPAVVARILADQGVTVTIGHDAATAEVIRQTGNNHQQSRADEIVIDEANRMITTAAYMCASSISETGAGIEKLVAAVVQRA
ncbi:MAG: isoprenoid biosynthesis glyoxalase ElbB [Magnetococcales bacterium]|nr:isoprenoid biosynthesis glyoxalase ElbB [Magnetococcales bacterium]